ncbi:MAG TPA: type II toxin-antitoxin system VapC family toxin [Stellaceae bacterium]|nr:type II toxin-antitoxin system VapC family toxin [Stellaceae bacterium]
MLRRRAHTRNDSPAQAGRRLGQVCADALATRNLEWAVGERRGRLDAPRRRRPAGSLHALPIKLDAETASQAWTATARSAERFGLSVYDAAYLELAQRHQLRLATLDRDLRSAATALGVTVLGS